MEKLGIIGVCLYLCGVVYFNIFYVSFWTKIEQNIDVTLVEIENAKNELFTQSMPLDEYLEKCEILKDLAEDMSAPTISSKEISDKESLFLIIEEDILYLTQDLHFDITITEKKLDLIKNRILQLEEIKLKFEHTDFYELQIEYELDKEIHKINSLH